MGELQIGAAANVNLNWRRFGGKIVLAHCFADHGLRKFKSIAMGGALVAAPVALALMFPTRKADATPYFARQTGRNCNFCHRGVPRLNPTGLAFKHNGFLFSDSNKAPNEQHKDTPAP
ncbi:MAG: hypothetical protein ACREDI_10435 [Roseiarcus sp.]